VMMLPWKLRTQAHYVRVFTKTSHRSRNEQMRALSSLSVVIQRFLHCIICSISSPLAGAA
jgi:hypothetical protein